MSAQGHLFAVTGACVSGPSDSYPILVRRGRDESWLLHADGRTELLAETETPAFLLSIDIELHLPCFEISAASTARWLAQRRGTRWRLTEIGSSKRNEYDLDIDVLDAWKRACRDTNGAQLWKAQLSMAGGAT